MRKMKRLGLISLAALCGGVLFSQAVSSNGRAPKFSSAYTDLKARCASTLKSAERGDDTPLNCGGYGGYEIRIDFSAASSHLRVQPRGNRSEEAIALATQPLDYNAKRKIEWRLADGRPFAVILRVDKSREGVDPTEMWRPENKRGEALVVKGLKGYERIDFEVDAKEPNANAKAREMADAAYTKGR